MSTVINTYTGDGSQVLFSVTFPFISVLDITATVDGGAVSGITKENDTTIRFPTAPANGAAVVIRRITRSDAPLNEFSPSSTAPAAAYNQNFEQALYVAEEAREEAKSAVAGELPTGSVGTILLADDAVTTAKIEDGAVTEAKTSASVQASLAKADTAAPLDSPGLTGTPTAPTPAAKDNDTSIATTAFVQSAVVQSGPLAGFRNAVINGNFDVWQRGTSFTVTNGFAWSADRWSYEHDRSGVTTLITREDFALGQTAVPGEPTHHIRFNKTVLGSGGSYEIIYQSIEDVRTFAGQEVTLSFWAKAGASLTLPLVRINQSFGSGGSPSAQVFNVAATDVSVTTSWQKYTYTLTLPSIAGKTLGTDGNHRVAVSWTPPDALYSLDIAQVQLELGHVATPFERRPIGTELALCQRYYFGPNTVESGKVYQSGATGILFAHDASWPTAMRAAPTITTSSITYSNCSALTPRGLTTVSSRFVVTAGTTGYADVKFNYTALAEL